MYVLLAGLAGCADSQPEQTTTMQYLQDTTVYTAYSNLPNEYVGFNSPKAINEIAEMENAYFRNYNSGISKWYGTVWRESVETDTFTNDEQDLFQTYSNHLACKADSMHCTIYAVKALSAGLPEESFAQLEQSHKRIWGNREHAGWSIGYLLVKELNWQAYLVMDPESVEYDQCLRAFRRSGKYPVWRQPDIPLEAVYIRGEQDEQIDSLLSQNEFGWGFSHQGIHTWITRFNELKECNWLGAPCAQYEYYDMPLFNSIPFIEYWSYQSHVLIFPPKAKDA